MIGEGPLDQRLTIVEVAPHCDGCHVLVRDGGHLPPLEVRNHAFGEEDDDLEVMRLTAGLDRGRARIATGSSENGPVVSISVQEPGHDLERMVLERERGAPEQLENQAIADLNYRSDVGMIEASRCSDDCAFDVCGTKQLQ